MSIEVLKMETRIDKFNESKRMSRVAKNIDLYKEMVGEESSVDDIKKNIDDIVNLIQSQQNVLEFLSENKNMWNVQNGKIQFDDDILLNQYNQLLLAVQ